MTNSTTSKTTAKNGKPAKPSKPYPDFPLYAHASRRWAKKIRGKTLYFGPWGDPSGALELYRHQADDLHAGRVPTMQSDTITVVELCNQFIRHKKDLAACGELTGQTVYDYQGAARQLRDFFGRTRTVDSLKTADFAGLRNCLAKGLKAVTLCVRIQRVRSIFKFAYDADLIDRPVKFGPGFAPPSRKVIRIEKNNRGPVMFSAKELRKLLAALPIQLRTMTLLGINCGLGNTDCAKLPQSALDLDGGWINYPRPKTGVNRRCKLWPETVEALREAIGARPQPLDSTNDTFVFLRAAGTSWFVDSKEGPVSTTFTVASKTIGVHQLGRGFSALRKTFRTVASEHLDEPAADLIMGHTRGDMASVYRQTISDERLIAVTDFVRAWLWPASAE